MKPLRLPLHKLPLTLWVMLISCLALPAVGQANPEQVAAGPGGAVTTVVVAKARAGDSLDKLIGAQYRNSPFRMDILRVAVLSANPDLTGTGVRLKVGQEIVLPAHKDIAVSVLGPLMPAPAPAESAAVLEPMQRRNWIRYP